jgi:hypothetical protein
VTDTEAQAHIWVHDDSVHGYWVEPGSILAGEYPGALDPDQAAHRVDLLIANGVRTFVDLTSCSTTDRHLLPYEHLIAPAAERHEVEASWVNHPLPDMGVGTRGDYDSIVATIVEATERGVVYVHCWGGIGRTATVVGCLLVDQGLDGGQALERIGTWRALTRKAHQPAPQHPTQFQVIHDRASAQP